MSSISRGFLWSAIERFSVQGIGFLLSIIIARIVSPDAYGLIVMIQVFMSFSQVFIDSGFTSALIQKQDRTEDDYYTAFIFNFAVAFGLYVLLFIGAPFIAEFYDEPLLVSITRLVALNLIFSSFSLVQRARLTIDLDFKTQSKASIFAVCVSGVVGIICAYSGMEVWALVIQGLLNQIITSLALMFFSKWTPKLRFSTNSFCRLFNYGSKLLVNNLLTSVSIQIYSLVIGKRFSSADLAFYNRGFTLSQFPSTNIADVLDRIIFPVLSKLQNDREKMISTYFRYLHLSNFIILPLMGFLIVLAPPLIEVVLTPKWIPAVKYIQIFSLNFMFYAWLQQSGNLIAAIGNTGLLLKAQIVKRVMSLIIIVSTIGFGIDIMCWGFVVGAILETVTNVYLDRIELGIKILSQIRSLFDVILSTALACFAIWLFMLFFDNIYIQLFGGSVIGFAVYVLMVFVFRMSEKEILVSVLHGDLGFLKSN